MVRSGMSRRSIEEGSGEAVKEGFDLRERRSWRGGLVGAQENTKGKTLLETGSAMRLVGPLGGKVTVGHWGLPQALERVGLIF